MEKKLRASLVTSADAFLSSATTLGFKPGTKAFLKTLITTISPSSDLCSSLPIALHASISRSIDSFKSPKATVARSSPPAKRVRRSSRARSKSENRTPEEGVNRGKGGSKPALQELQILAHVANLCASHPARVISPSDLLPAALALHDHLVVFESDSVLSSEIANLCELWWKEDLPGRETLISQLLPFLLSRSLTLNRKVDVHRVYSLREAFVLFDFEDESIEDLKSLLLRCLISPLYLKAEEGRRFMAFVFGLNGKLLKEALAMIRSQVPFGRKSMLEGYADTVFRAWKAAEGTSAAVRDEIENAFLLGFIDAAIHASSVPLAASVRRVLGGFINQRTVDGVEKILFRLAEPVLFRSLQVANSKVRLNALHLLIDVFPLEDPDATKEVKDTLLDKQFFLLEKLLMDVCPDVRVVAVEGSCRILNLFWEVISPSCITKILTKIFDDMSHDICNEVRLSTLNGIIYLLGNPQSHEVLRVLLPRFGHLISDSALSIRVAVVDLLLILRDIRTFQFYKVVAMDALLSTLANDQPPVAEKVTKLLIASYFPSKLDIKVACDRCLTLVKRSPMAGARFCEFASSQGALLKPLLELIRVFINLVLSPDKLDRDQIEGLVIAAAYLCNDLVNEHMASLKRLFSSEKLKCLFDAAPTARAQFSVLNIFSKVYPDDESGLEGRWHDTFADCSNLSANVERQNEIRAAQKLVLSCGWFDGMFNVLTGILSKLKKTINSPNKTQSKCKNIIGRKSSKTSVSKFEEDYLVAAGIAWQVKELLITENGRKGILTSPFLGRAFSALKVISELSILQCIHFDYMDVYPTLAYMEIALHITIRKVFINVRDNRGSTIHDALGPAKSSSEGTLLDQTIDHIFSCTDKLIGACRELAPERQHSDAQTDGCCPSDNTESTFTVQKRISNAVKMLTAVLKFVVEATASGITHHKHKKCLTFASAYLQYFTSTLGQYFHSELHTEDMEETFVCIKSSFTYVAKLLNLVLKDAMESPPSPPEAYGLASDILDLIAITELHLGSKHTTRFAAVMKQWLPDLVLALGSKKISNQVPEDGGASLAAAGSVETQLPAWASMLAKSELYELTRGNRDEDAGEACKPVELPTFKKLAGMMVEMCKRNVSVHDAFGMVFLNVSAVGLERKEFGLFLGLVHFVCSKVVGQEGEVGWGELGMMVASLPAIYAKMEGEAAEAEGGEEWLMLQTARELLEPVCNCYVNKTRNDSMREE